jgi:hypothetical protein
VVDWGRLPDDPAEVLTRSRAAVRAVPRPELGGWLPAAEVAELRLVGAWVAAHEPPVLELGAHTDAGQLARFVSGSLQCAA